MVVTLLWVSREPCQGCVGRVIGEDLIWVVRAIMAIRAIWVVRAIRHICLVSNRRIAFDVVMTALGLAYGYSVVL